MHETQVYQEVKDVILSWVKDLNDNDPTREDEEKLGNSIVALDVEKRNGPEFATSDSQHVDSAMGESNDESIEPKTLLDLARYAAATLNHDQLTNSGAPFMVIGKGGNVQYSSCPKFLEELGGVELDQVLNVQLFGRVYIESQVSDAYKHIRSKLCKSSELVEKINKVAWSFTTPEGESESVLKWDKSFVEATDEDDLKHIRFCDDISKSAALVVAGESGSGKTWFSQNYIPSVLRPENLARIFYSIEDNDGQKGIISDPEVKKTTMACQKCMHYLSRKKDGDVYKSVRQLAMEYNKERDELAYSWLNQSITKALRGDADARAWWENGDQAKYERVEKLVVVIDEVGKNPELGRGLVSMVRRFYSDMRQKADRVLLVLVGSGLDWHIRNDSLPQMTNEETRKSFASFGTDPWKSNIIVLKGPNLSDRHLQGIPTNAILQGTYSRVLATNTRMLTRGVLPIMTTSILTDHLSDKAARYVAIGSTTILMDYASRNYTSLNGLGRLNVTDLPKALSTQFKILLWVSLKSVQGNPEAKHLQKQLLVPAEDWNETLVRGLITSDVTSTSAALRYLACDGNTAPLYARDGFGFEIVLQHHLVRLCLAANTGSIQNVSNLDKYWVGTYSLTQAWPPSSSKGDTALSDGSSDVLQEVERQYDNCKKYLHEQDMPDGYANDIKWIVENVQEREEFDLVMRQNVVNVQGPDIMILTRREGQTSLQLFQAKNTKEIPRVNSTTFKKACWSLGVQIGENFDDINITPNSGSAGYSYHGTMRFAKELGKNLGTDVSIAERVIVFSRNWAENHNDTAFLEKAMGTGVKMWTREMLEPTVSALYLQPTNDENMEVSKAHKGKKRK